MEALGAGVPQSGCLTRRSPTCRRAEAHVSRLKAKHGDGSDPADNDMRRRESLLFTCR